MSEDYINYNYKMPVKKQTAVDWLVEKLDQNFDYVADTLIEQAKQMEKKQIVDAYCLGHIFHDSNDSDSAEEYYNTEYGGNK